MPDQQTELPIGILRLREQWRAEGLLPPESESSAGGNATSEDFNLTEDQALAILGISARELHTLISQGKLVCAVPDATGRRLLKGDEVRRYLERSPRRALAVQASGSPEPPTPDEKKPESHLQEALLLELRNLKEQQRDLTAFVFELTEKISRNGHEKRTKRRWYYLWLK